MAVKLNLLPENFKLTGPIARVVKFMRPLNVILLALFLVTVIGMGGFFIFSSISLRNLAAANDSLKQQIQTQSTAQQQIVLLKDRLKLINMVQSLPDSLKNLTGVGPLLSTITGTSLVSELGVDTQKTTVSLVFKSNSDLTTFVKGLENIKTFAAVTLSAFSYNPSTGYLVSLNLGGK